MADLLFFPMVFSESRIEFVDSYSNISGQVVGQLKINPAGSKFLKFEDYVSASGRVYFISDIVRD